VEDRWLSALMSTSKFHVDVIRFKLHITSTYNIIFEINGILVEPFSLEFLNDQAFFIFHFDLFKSANMMKKDYLN